MFDVSCSPHLDHVFLTVDDKTLADIKASELLTNDSFCRFRIKSATSTLLGPYETANVLGDSTFVEFFPQDRPPLEGVSLGVVLSFDQVGTSLAARAHFEEVAGIRFAYELNQRKMPDEDDPQPWYHLVRPDMGNESPVTVFLSEITPVYFDRIGAERDPEGKQSRSAYLNAAVGTSHRPDQVFQNIRAAKLHLVSERRDKFAQMLTELGYDRRTDGDALVLTGPEATFYLAETDPGSEGLAALSLELAMPHTAPGEIHRFGHQSTLTLSPDGPADRTAIWTFKS